jgi:hypothetical protein
VYLGFGVAGRRAGGLSSGVVCPDRAGYFPPFPDRALNCQNGRLAASEWLAAFGSGRQPGGKVMSQHCRLVELGILGPVEVRADGQVLDTGHPRRRAVLAVLLLELGRTIPAEVLIDRVWGRIPPPRR